MERTERYECARCGAEWDQVEEWDDAEGQWRFADEPYGLCRACTPAAPTPEELLKSAHSSLCITFGTTAPFSIGGFGAERVGFAGIPSVVVGVTCRDEDLPAMVPIVRQRLYRELAERGWTPDDVEFSPSTQRGRQRRFRDENESSASCGRNKFGYEVRFRFGMGRALTEAAFAGGGWSFRRLPDRTVAA